MKLTKTPISWARAHGWKRIVVGAHADLYCRYGIKGKDGRTFREKAGFEVIGTSYREESAHGEWHATLEGQAAEKGMSKERGIDLVPSWPVNCSRATRGPS